MDFVYKAKNKDEEKRTSKRSKEIYVLTMYSRFL